MRVIAINLALLIMLLLVSHCGQDERFVQAKCFDYSGAETPCD